MSKQEISELMELNGWSRARLADEVGVGQNAVDRWFSDRDPGGAASKLMRLLLREARGEITITENQPHTNGKHRRAAAV